MKYAELLCHSLDQEFIKDNRKQYKSWSTLTFPYRQVAIPFRCMWLLFRDIYELDMQYEAVLSDRLNYFVVDKEETYLWNDA